ncbi:hypothetical protein GCM10022222_39270 [Amycolatopsis ultiminotia]|uniref:Uncharacterized protein n=1 Tax=Amycolatopsis ultiminotia TaxID=543629 RepID=A0ABP6WM78_9PSEU
MTQEQARSYTFICAEPGAGSDCTVGVRPMRQEIAPVAGLHRGRDHRVGDRHHGRLGTVPATRPVPEPSWGEDTASAGPQSGWGWSGLIMVVGG